MEQIREDIVQSTETWQINILNVIFIGLNLMSFFGLLIRSIEPKLPSAIQRFLRYGKHCYKGKSTDLLYTLEVPKSWFSHFYIFALMWSLWSVCLVVQVVILQKDLPKYAEYFLTAIAGGRTRKVLLNSTATIIVTVLMCLQCGRRCYETHFVQIFSSKGRMHVSYYFLGYLHYFLVIATLQANAQGFVPNSAPSTLSLAQITFSQYIAMAIFIYSWWQQYCCNIILVNLRKDKKTGKIASDKHLMPTGGFFELVSSPHMLFEIMMYMALLPFLPQSQTWWLVVTWVVSNQFLVALFSHQWYKDNFKDYPRNRKAILPFIL